MNNVLAMGNVDFLMAVQPEIDDVAHAQRGNVRQLRFARLAGRGYPVIETMPVINGFGIDHYRNISGLGGDRRNVNIGKLPKSFKWF